MRVFIEVSVYALVSVHLYFAKKYDRMFSLIFVRSFYDLFLARLMMINVEI